MRTPPEMIEIPAVEYLALQRELERVTAQRDNYRTALRRVAEVLPASSSVVGYARNVLAGQAP